MKEVNEEEKRNAKLKGEETEQLKREKQYELKLKNEPNLKTFLYFFFNLLFFYTLLILLLWRRYVN